MHVEIRSLTEIALTPETKAEDAIVSGRKWTAKIEEPKPMELNVRALVLRADAAAEPQKGK